MAKAAETGLSQGRALYKFLHREGIPDQEIERSGLSPPQGKAAPEKPDLGQQAIRYVFDHWGKFSGKVQEDIKKLGFNPSDSIANRKLAEGLIANKNFKEARFYLFQAIRFAADLPELQGLQKIFADPANKKLLKGENPWEMIGQILFNEENYSLAAGVFQRASESSANPSLKKYFSEKQDLALEAAEAKAGNPYLLDFTETNPIALQFYNALRSYGVPSKNFEAFEGAVADRCLNAAEVFGFIGNNLEDPRVQDVLQRAGIQLEASDRVRIVEDGFGLFMAEKFARQAEGLKEKDTKKNFNGIAENLQRAALFDSNNPSRYQALGDFFSEHQHHAEAMHFYSAALEVDPKNESYKNKIQEFYQKGAADGMEQAKGFQSQGKLKEAAEALEQIALLHKSASDVLYKEKPNTPENFRAMGSVSAELGRIYARLGENDKSKEYFHSAIQAYQQAIKANLNGFAVIPMYLEMSEAQHAIGDFAGALKSKAIASNCKKMALKLESGHGMLASYEEIRATKNEGHDYLDGKKVDWAAGRMEGNYIPTQAHQIDINDPADFIPAWADQGVKEYYSRLEDQLKKCTAERNEAEQAAQTNYSQLGELLSEEVQLQTALGEAEKALALAEKLNDCRKKLKIEQQIHTAQVLTANGFVHDVAMMQDDHRMGRGAPDQRPLSHYVTLQIKNHKRELIFSENFETLDDGGKLQILDALVKVGRREVSTQEGPILSEKQFVATEHPSAPLIPQEVVGELKGLLGPLMSSLYQGKDNTLDWTNLSRDEIQNAEDFRKFLVSQAAIDAGTTVPLLFSAYNEVLDKTEYKPLMEILYAEFSGNKEFQPSLSLTELNERLHALTQDIAEVSFSKFAQRNLTAKGGPTRLREILQDSTHFDVNFRANLLEEIMEAADKQGYCPEGLWLAFNKQIDTWTPDIIITDQEIRNATRMGLRVLDIVEQAEVGKTERKSKYSDHAEEIVALQAKGLRKAITPERIREVAKLYEAGTNKPDPPSVMQSKLANLWLMVADNSNWTKSSERIDEEVRAFLINNVEQLLEESKNLNSETEFLAFNERVGKFLDGTASTDDSTRWNNIMAIIGVDDVAGVFQALPSHVTDTYSALNKSVAEYQARVDMDQPIPMGPADIQIGDKKAKEKIQTLIQGLEGLKGNICYQYKQRSWVVRGAAHVYGLNQIQGANKKIDELIDALKRSKTQEDLQAVRAMLTQTMQEGGALHQGLNLANPGLMDQVWDLGKVMAEIAAMTILTRGVGIAATVARSTRAAYQVLRAERMLAAGQRVQQGFRALNSTRAVVTDSARALRMARAVTGSGEQLALFEQQLAASLKTIENTEGLSAAARVRQTKAAWRAFAGQVGKEEAIWLQSLSQAERHQVNLLEAKLKRQVTRFDMMSKAERMQAMQRETFNIGLRINPTGEVTSWASDQVRDRKVTVLGMLKDALSTAASMAIAGPLAPGALTEGLHEHLGSGLMRGVFQRYSMGGLKAVGHLSGDVACEIFEEVLDNYTNRFLGGDRHAMSFEEFRDITMICSIGGGSKLRTVVDIARGEISPALRQELEGDKEILEDHGTRDEAPSIGLASPALRVLAALGTAAMTHPQIQDLGVTAANVGQLGQHTLLGGTAGLLIAAAAFLGKGKKSTGSVEDLSMPPVKERRPSGIHPKDSDLHALGEKAETGNIEAQRILQQRVYDQDPEAVEFVIRQAQDRAAWAMDCLSHGAVVDSALQDDYLQALQNYHYAVGKAGKREGYLVHERFISEGKKSDVSYRVINWDPQGKTLWLASDTSGEIRPVEGIGVDQDRPPAFHPGERVGLVQKIPPPRPTARSMKPSEAPQRKASQPFPLSHMISELMMELRPEIQGNYYQARREVRSDGSVWITAWPKVDGTGKGNEGDLAKIAKDFPEVARKLDITVHPDGSVTYPDCSGLNQRLEAHGFGFRFWDPQEKDLKGGEKKSEAGQATFMATLEHLAKDPVEFPLAREGSEHFHDLGVHLLAYLVLPREVLQQISQTAKVLLELSRSPEFAEEGPAREVLIRTIETFIDGGTDLLTGILAKKVKQIRRTSPELNLLEPIYANLRLVSERSDLARTLSQLSRWLSEEALEENLTEAQEKVEQLLQSTTAFQVEIFSRESFPNILQGIYSTEFLKLQELRDYHYEVGTGAKRDGYLIYERFASEREKEGKHFRVINWDPEGKKLWVTSTDGGIHPLSGVGLDRNNKPVFQPGDEIILVQIVLGAGASGKVAVAGERRTAPFWRKRTADVVTELARRLGVDLSSIDKYYREQLLGLLEKPTEINYRSYLLQKVFGDNFSPETSPLTPEQRRTLFIKAMLTPRIMAEDLQKKIEEFTHVPTEAELREQEAKAAEAEGQAVKDILAQYQGWDREALLEAVTDLRGEGTPFFDKVADALETKIQKMQEGQLQRLEAEIAKSDRAEFIRKIEKMGPRANQVLDRLNFGARLRQLAASDPNLVGKPFSILNRFLRSELGAEPAWSEVKELQRVLRNESDDLRTYIHNCTEVGPPIFQIYTKEFLNAMSSYIIKLREDFRKKYGRDPVITEIAAGDGRLSAALNRRLESLGIRIQATDTRSENMWDIEFPTHVREMEAEAAASNADIILSSWMPLEGNADVRVAHVVKNNPQKTWISINAGYLGSTNTPEFWNLLGAGPRLGSSGLDSVSPHDLNRTHEGDSLTTSREGIQDDRELTSVDIYRSKDGDPIPEQFVNRFSNFQTSPTWEEEYRQLKEISVARFNAWNTEDLDSTAKTFVEQGHLIQALPMFFELDRRSELASVQSQEDIGTRLQILRKELERYLASPEETSRSLAFRTQNQIEVLEGLLAELGLEEIAPMAMEATTKTEPQRKESQPVLVGRTIDEVLAGLAPGSGKAPPGALKSGLLAAAGAFAFTVGPAVGLSLGGTLLMAGGIALLPLIISMTYFRSGKTTDSELDPYLRCVAQTRKAGNLAQQGMKKEAFNLLLQTAEAAKLEIINLEQRFFAQLTVILTLAEIGETQGANGILREAAQTANAIKDPKKREQTRAQITSAVKGFGLSDPNLAPWQPVPTKKGVLISRKGKLSLGAAAGPPKIRMLWDKIGNDVVRLAAFAQALLDQHIARLRELDPQQIHDAELVVHALKDDNTIPPDLTFLSCLDDYTFEAKKAGAGPGDPFFQMAFHAPARDGKLPPNKGRNFYYDVVEVNPDTGVMTLRDQAGEIIAVEGAIQGVSHPFQVEPGEQVVVIYPMEGGSGIKPGRPIPLQWRNKQDEPQPVRLGRDLFAKYDPNNFENYGPQISINHAQLEWTPDGFLLSDVGSRNGTFIYEKGGWIKLERGERGTPGEMGKPGKAVKLEFIETGRSQLIRLGNGYFYFDKNDWQLYAIPSPMVERPPSPVPTVSPLDPPVANLGKLPEKEIQRMARKGLDLMLTLFKYDLLKLVQHVRYFRPEPGNFDGNRYYQTVLEAMPRMFGVDVAALNEMDEGRRAPLPPLMESFSGGKIPAARETFSVDADGVRLTVKRSDPAAGVQSHSLNALVQAIRFDPDNPNNLQLDLYASTGLYVGPPEGRPTTMPPVSRLQISLPITQVVALGIPIHYDSGTLDSQQPAIGLTLAHERPLAPATPPPPAPKPTPKSVETPVPPPAPIKIREDAKLPPPPFGPLGAVDFSASPVLESELKELRALKKRARVEEALKDPTLKPQTKIQVEGMTFYCSGLLEVNFGQGSAVRKYPVVIAFVPVVENGRKVLKLSLFYQSTSGGGWRSSPFKLGDKFIKENMGREEGVYEGGHYTAEGQPVPEIKAFLLDLQRLAERDPSAKQSMEGFQLDRYVEYESPLADLDAKKSMVYGFGKEVHFPKIEGLQTAQGIKPGKAFNPEADTQDRLRLDTTKLRQKLQKMRYPDGFIPNFQAGPRRPPYSGGVHPFFGEIIISEYEGILNGRTVVWAMAEATGKDGITRCWAEAIHFANAKVNRYGVHDDVIDGGVLQSKPAEYAKQAALIPLEFLREIPGIEKYVDQTPLLDLLRPVQEYRAARGIPAQVPTAREIFSKHCRQNAKNQTAWAKFLNLFPGNAIEFEKALLRLTEEDIQTAEAWPDVNDLDGLLKQRAVNLAQLLQEFHLDGHPEIVRALTYHTQYNCTGMLGIRRDAI